MVDRDVVLRKLAELDICRNQLKEFSNLTVASYRADWKAQRIVERTLQMMIETCADVANHIVADRGMRPPTSYADTFKVLSENAVIGEDLFEIMQKMAKFRNVVVHQYEGVDAEIVVLILQRQLSDFDRYRDAVVAYLKGLKS